MDVASPAMAPPFLDANISGRLQSYFQPYPQVSGYNLARPTETDRKRRDSILHNQGMAIGPILPYQQPFQRPVSEQDQYTQISGVNGPWTAPRGNDTRDIKASLASEPDQEPFRFCVTMNPNKLVDRSEMQKIRKHVMHDYLRKEGRKNPVERDARAAKSVQGGKRRRVKSDSKPVPPKSQNPAAPSQIFDMGHLTPQSMCDGTVGSFHGDSECDTQWASFSRTTSQAPSEPFADLASVPGSYAVPKETEHYSRAFAHKTNAPNSPSPFELVGFKVAPYHSWLQIAIPSVDLEKLKYDCARRLRSKVMASAWLPTLLQAKHSFLSTICISTAHDEAMRRLVFGSDGTKTRRLGAISEQLAVKNEVYAMINASLDDPKQATSDGTIIAVMNVLNSEMIGCNLTALEAHHQGLDLMVAMRGGLDELGVKGHLARTLTVTMLANAVLQEKPAGEMYLLYSRSQANFKTTKGTAFLESPIYHGEGYVHPNSLQTLDSETLKLLMEVWDLTCAFRASTVSSSGMTEHLAEQILNLELKRKTSHQTRDDRMVEAIHLAAKVYASILKQRTSFSQSRCDTQVRSTHPSGKSRPAAFVQIAHVLRYTDLDTCWAHVGLSGVLFWIVLVAAAAARRAKIKEVDDDAAHLANEREEEEARRWLTAVAVRCSILLGFENGSAVLSTLRNMLAVQEKLVKCSSVRRRRKACFDPKGTFARQNGFDDFAWDFLAAGEH